MVGWRPRAGRALSCASPRHSGRRPMPAVEDSAGGEASAAELVFDRVPKRYPGPPTPAVNSLSLVVPAGEICVLVGPSGAGKTTAMKMVNRLIDIPDGGITLHGNSPRAHR